MIISPSVYSQSTSKICFSLCYIAALINDTFHNVCFHVFKASLQFFKLSFCYNYFNTLQLLIDLTIHFISSYLSTADIAGEFMKKQFNFIKIYLLKTVTSLSAQKLLGDFFSVSLPLFNSCSCFLQHLFFFPPPP